MKGLTALAEAILDSKRRSDVVSCADAIGKSITERLEDRNHRVRCRLCQCVRHRVHSCVHLTYYLFNSPFACPLLVCYPGILLSSFQSTMYPSNHPSFLLSVFLSISLRTYLSIYLSTYVILYFPFPLQVSALNYRAGATGLLDVSLAVHRVLLRAFFPLPAQVNMTLLFIFTLLPAFSRLSNPR